MFQQAYRLEPLIIKAYGTIAPIRIFRHDSTKRVPYDSLPTVALSKKDAKKEEEKNALLDSSLKEETNNNTDMMISTKSSPEKKNSPLEKTKKETSSYFKIKRSYNRIIETY